jgi:hypothetical protein
MAKPAMAPAPRTVPQSKPSAQAASSYGSPGSNALAAMEPGAVVDTALTGVAEAALSLPHFERIQQAFGAHDVSHVRAAIGGTAGDAAKAIGASAYTIGDRIAFRGYPDLHLAAHEAAHVVQQRAGLALEDGVGKRGDVHEQHADAVADAVVEGRSAEAMLGPTRSTGGAAGVQLACDCGACAACAVQRAADDASLAPTPGGLRLGVLDPEADPAVNATFKDILPNVQTLDLSALERYYEAKYSRSLANTERFSNDISRDYGHATQALDGRVSDVSLRNEAKTMLARDVAVVFARAFQQGTKLDVPAIGKAVTSIGATYERLAYIYTSDQIERQSGLPTDVMSLATAFERRGQLFLDFAKEKLGNPSAGLLRVRQGLAADLARLAANERDGVVLAPDRGAELVVYELLANPPRVEELVDLFAKVVEDARIGARPAASALLYVTFRESAEEMIRAPIRDKLNAATTDLARADARRKLSITIGRFLARLEATSAFYDTAWYVADMGLGTSTPKRVYEQLEAAEKEYEAPPPPAPAPAPARPRAIVIRCPTTYSESSVAGYFDKLIDVKRTTRDPNVKFSAEDLLCQFRGGAYDNKDLARTYRHLADWKEGAGRVARELRRQVEAAKHRDAEIARRRGKIDPALEKQALDIPDLVVELKVAQDFWFLLQHTVDDGDFDTTGAEEMYEQLSLPYWFALRRYQEQLLAMSKLVMDTEKDGLAGYIHEKLATTVGLAFAEFRARTLELERWPWPQNNVLKDSEGIAAQIDVLQLSLDKARADRTAEHRAEIENEIYGLMEEAITVLRADPKVGERDILRTDEIYEAMKPNLTTVGKDETYIAKEIITAALGDVHRWRYAELSEEANKAMARNDTKAVAEHAKRLEELRRQLGMPITERRPEMLLSFVQQQSTNLIGLFVMAQTSLVVGETMNPDTPGGVMRAANLLRIAMQQGGAATLGEAYEWVKNNELELMAAAHDPGHRTKIMADTKKGMIDALEIWAAGAVGAPDSLVFHAIRLLKDSKRSGALKYLIAAEGKAGGENRKLAIAELANMLGEKSPSHSKATAKLIYSYLLDAVEELKEASDVAKEKLAAAEDAKKKLEARAEQDKNAATVAGRAGSAVTGAAAVAGNAGHVKTSQELKEEAAWRAAIEDVQLTLGESFSMGLGNKTPAMMLEARAEKKREATLTTFRNHKHPVHDNRFLTPAEEHWFSEYERLGGFFEEGWAKLKEFAKGLLVAYAVGVATGGLGELFIGGFDLGVVGTVGVKIGEVAAFTESMRVIQDLQTGQSPNTWFLEDFAVNLAMMGAGMYSTGRMARALESEGIALKSMKGRINLFVAEYLATSFVGLAHLELSTLWHGGGVTSADVRTSLVHNFGFLVGMKGLHAFSELPEFVFKNEAKTWKDPAVVAKFEALNEILAEYDKKIRKTVEEVLKVETPEEREALLKQHEELLRGKAARIKESGIPDAEKVAESFNTGADVFAADAKRAITLEKIGAKDPGDPNNPNISYERGKRNEAALEAMLIDSEANFKSFERADGSRVFLVYTSEGMLRYEPREPGTGASQKEAYTRTGRLKGEVIPGKTKGNLDVLETGKEVADVLKANRALLHKAFPPVVGETFVIGVGAAACTVTLKVAKNVTSSADHGAGPAVFELKMNTKGEWEATITVRKDTPNDQVVRAVNHEVAELAMLLPRLEARAKQPGATRNAYQTGSTLAKAMKEEISAKSVTDPTKALSAHAISTFDADVVTLEAQLRDVNAQLQKLGPGDPARELLEQRRDLLLKDAGAIWVMLEMPAKKGEFEARVKDLEKQGIATHALLSLKAMRIAEIEGTVTLVDLQIIFNELKKANPNLVEEGSFHGMKLYYEEKVREEVDAAVAKARKKPGATELEVRGAAIAAAREGLSRGTSIASWRGRAYEGLLIDAFNKDPVLVAAYGRLYQIELNNFPTYDVVGIKLTTGKNAAGVSVKAVPTPLHFEVEAIKSGGKETKVLVVKDANGREVARQGPDGKVIARAGLEVWLASLKAKDSANITEMQKAIGTPTKPTEQFMFVTPEYIESLDGMIQRTRDNITRLTGKKGVARELAAAKTRLQKLEFFKKNIKVMDDLTNARIDSLLKLLKEAGIDTDAIIREATKKKKKSS